MLKRVTQAPSALRHAATAARPSARASHRAPSRYSSTLARTLHRPVLSSALRLRAAVVLGAGFVALASFEDSPALLPTLLAEVAVPEDHYIDPTTSTPFPRTLTSPSGTLQLVGTGVRTVSFLAIKVYAVGFYVDQKALKDIKDGKVPGWKGYTRERMLPPYKPLADAGALQGEALMNSLLETQHDFAVCIIPLRSTTLPHLRDGFSRALVARIKLPAVAASMDDEESENASTALTQLKGYFPNRALAKGSPLFAYLSGTDRSVRFATRDPTDPDAVDNLGTLHHSTLARQLFLSYFSDGVAASEELRKSVAGGFAGEAR